jgi:glycosyltransferase involved in cell wall biosynthesis
LLELMAAVHRARPEWTLELMTGSEGDLADAAHDIGIRASVVPMPPALAQLGDAGAGGPAGDAISKSSVMAGLSSSVPQVAGYVLKLRRLLCERDAEVVHSNGFKTHILAAWAAPRRSKVIWHVRDYAGSRPLMSRLMRMHARRCEAAIANSHSVARDLEAACAGRLKIVRTVYNAVDLERFSPRGRVLDLDALAGLPPAPAGTVRVGLVATMARWKGHGVFLRALSMLPKELPIRSYVIGGPIYSTAGSQRSVDELRTLASGLGLNGNAGFTGFVNEPAAAIRALDIVVHASTEPEPFGRVIAEAMACGKAVVASLAGGAAEIVVAGTDSLGHAPGDAAGLAENIRRLALDADLRGELGTASRSGAEQRFDRGRLTRDVLGVYDSVLVGRN